MTTLRTLDDALALRSEFESTPGRVVVVGAGFIGAEVAATARGRDLDVTMIEMAEVPLDMVQLHGCESPERVAEVRARTGLPVMKALGIASEEDVGRIALYGRVADQLLLDAKAPKGAELPGGNGLAFDWRLLQGRHWTVPWMLAGGLTPENVALAAKLTGARQVDVSSGVESAPGEKDADRIGAFLKAVS